MCVWTYRSTNGIWKSSPKCKILPNGSSSLTPFLFRTVLYLVISPNHVNFSDAVLLTLLTHVVRVSLNRLFIITLFWLNPISLMRSSSVSRFVLLISRKISELFCFGPFGRLDHFSFLLDLAIPHVVSFLSIVVTYCSWLVVPYLKFETISFVLWTVPAVMAIFAALTTNSFVLLGIGMIVGKFKLEGRIECSRLEMNGSGEGTIGLERGMCLIPRKYIWPALSRSKDPRVLNAQERSRKERPSLARFLLQRCSGKYQSLAYVDSQVVKIVWVV